MGGKNQKKALFFAILAVFFWSTVPTAFKIALQEIDPLHLIFIASAVSILVFSGLLLATRKVHLLTQSSPAEIIRSALLGFLNPFAYYIILFQAYSLLPAQLAQPLNMVWPIVIALFSIPLLRQKIRWFDFTALFISFTGVIIITSQGGLSGFLRTDFTGVAFALGSSVIWALYWIFNARDKRDELVKLFLNFAFGFLLLLLAVLIFPGKEIRSGSSLWAALYTGLFEAGFTFVFWMKAMQYSTNNAVTGNLVYIAPFVSLIFIHLILKENIFITTFIGLLFIVGGILFQQYGNRTKSWNNPKR